MRALKSLAFAALLTCVVADECHALTFAPVITTDPASAATVQQQQIDATNAALANLATYFQPSAITLRVEFNFKDLGRDGTLGQAGPSGFRPINNVFYAQGLYNFITRTDLTGTATVLSVDMNTNRSVDWDYSNSTPPPGKYSWQDVIMHEVGHSMGLFDTVDKDGSYSEGGPSVFETLSFYNGAALSTYAQATRAQAVISNNVFWNGPYTVAANGNKPLKLYTPNPYEEGSNYSHIDPSEIGKGGIYFPSLADATYFPGPTAQELAIFHDIGWLTSPINVQLANISTRVVIGSGDQVGIAGFIIRGTGQKRVLIRGIGPSLGAFGVNGAIANPLLELNADTGVLKTNDHWRSAPEATEIMNTGAAPTDDREAAMVVTLEAGKNYTAVLKGANGGVGIGVVEVYDLSINNGRDLANIATRGQVLKDDQILIAGFIIQGLNSQSVAVRGIGPSLTAAGVSGALVDPTLEVRNGQGTLIRQNDNWRDDAAQAAALQQAGLAPKRDEEAAVIITAAPGSYTAQLRGKNNSTGVGLVEVYNLGTSSAATPSSAIAARPMTDASPAPTPLNPAGLRW